MFYSSPQLRSIYILGNGLLFDEIIAHMLTLDSKMRVIRRVYVDEATFLTDISWCHPDVVVLNEMDWFNCTQMLGLLSQISLTADLRVIAMSLQSNKVHVFDQAANQINGWVGIPYPLYKIGSWNELFDLVRGKPLLGVMGR